MWVRSKNRPSPLRGGLDNLWLRTIKLTPKIRKHIKVVITTELKNKPKKTTNRKKIINVWGPLCACRRPSPVIRGPPPCYYFISHNTSLTRVHIWYYTYMSMSYFYRILRLENIVSFFTKSFNSVTPKHLKKIKVSNTRQFDEFRLSHPDQISDHNKLNQIIIFMRNPFSGWDQSVKFLAAVAATFGFTSIIIIRIRVGSKIIHFYFNGCWKPN